METGRNFKHLAMIYGYKAQEMLIKGLLERKQRTESLTIQAEIREQITEARYKLEEYREKLKFDLEASILTLDQLTADMEEDDGFDDMLTKQVYLIERKIDRIKSTISV